MTETNCWATFHGEGGYELQRIRAKEILTIGQKYKVVGGEMGRYSTSIKLEGIEGSFNSVLFNIKGELPFRFEETYYTPGTFPYYHPSSKTNDYQ